MQASVLRLEVSVSERHGVLILIYTSDDWNETDTNSEQDEKLKEPEEDVDVRSCDIRIFNPSSSTFAMKSCPKGI